MKSNKTFIIVLIVIILGLVGYFFIDYKKDATGGEHLTDVESNIENEEDLGDKKNSIFLSDMIGKTNFNVLAYGNIKVKINSLKQIDDYEYSYNLCINDKCNEYTYIMDSISAEIIASNNINYVFISTAFEGFYNSRKLFDNTGNIIDDFKKYEHVARDNNGKFELYTRYSYNEDGVVPYEYCEDNKGLDYVLYKYDIGILKDNKIVIEKENVTITIKDTLRDAGFDECENYDRKCICRAAYND